MLGGLALLAAPAIVRASSLMPVKALSRHDQIMALLESRIRHAEEQLKNEMFKWYTGYETLNIDPPHPLLTEAEYEYVQLPVELYYAA